MPSPSPCFVKDHFIDRLAEEDRDELIYIQGMLEVFSNVWGSVSLFNPLGSQYESDRPQGIMVCYHQDPKTTYYCTCFANHRVAVTFTLMDLPDGSDFAEDTIMELGDLLQWARSQPQELGCFSSMLKEEESNV